MPEPFIVARCTRSSARNWIAPNNRLRGLMTDGTVAGMVVSLA